MKDRMFKLLGHLLQYLGGEQLVMCCTGLLIEVYISDELKSKD